MSAPPPPRDERAAGSGRADQPVGSLASEASQLVDAVQDWVKGAAFSRLAGGGTRPDSAPDGVWARATADPTEAPPRPAHADCPGCSKCPICRSVRLVQAAKPEVVEHLTDALTSIGAALRTLLAEERRQREERHTAEESPWH